ncbi:MAG: type II toxin-antitoxin system death-on-curing family toxin [Coriobacteriia bacterium]
MDREPRWVSRLVLETVHLDLLRTYGGMPGLRDKGGLESALARPQQKQAYEPDSDLPALAAAYGFGLARNHPFNDGNKRIAFVTMAVFLGLNGYDIEAPEAEVVTVMVGLAAGKTAEGELANWLRSRISPSRAD